MQIVGVCKKCGKTQALNDNMVCIKECESMDVGFYIFIFIVAIVFTAILRG